MNTHTTGKTMTQPTPLLSVRDLRVEVGERTVLESISLDIQSGELVVLMGANGSGKSTLGLTLAGHPRYRVSAGSARFHGQDLLAQKPEERRSEERRVGKECRSRWSPYH